MSDETQDIKEYRAVWRIILAKVLEYPQSKSDEWMSSRGDELLSKPGVVFHEEPWYWLCSEVVFAFSLNSERTDFLLSENGVFRVLASAFATEQVNDIDWEDVRTECKDAIIDRIDKTTIESDPVQQQELVQAICSDPELYEVVQSWSKVTRTMRQIVLMILQHERRRVEKKGEETGDAPR